MSYWMVTGGCYTFITERQSCLPHTASGQQTLRTQFMQMFQSFVRRVSEHPLLKSSDQKKSLVRLHFSHSHYKTVPRELLPRNRLHQTQKEPSSSVPLTQGGSMMIHYLFRLHQAAMNESCEHGHMPSPSSPERGW